MNVSCLNASNTAVQANSSQISTNTTNCTTYRQPEPTMPPPGQQYWECDILCYFSVSAYTIIMAVALLGNLLVVGSFFANRKIRKSSSSYFILSLAISDLFTAAVVMPFDLEQILTNYQWVHGEFLCVFWTMMYLLMIPTSIFNLLALSVDRYKTLVDPLDRFKESPFMTRRRALVVILFIWVYCLLFALIPVMGWKIYPNNVIAGQCVFNMSPNYSLLSSVVNVFLPLLVMCGLYIMIYRIASKLHVQQSTKKDAYRGSELRVHCSPRAVRKSSLKKHHQSRARSKEHKMLLKNKRAVKTVSVIVCTFVCCWMPFTVRSFINIVCISCYNSNPDSGLVLDVVFLLMGYLNSALNPFLFGLHNKQLKKTCHQFLRNLLELLTTCCRCRQTAVPPKKMSSAPTHFISQSGSIHMSSSESLEPNSASNNHGFSIDSLNNLS